MKKMINKISLAIIFFIIWYSGTLMLWCHSPVQYSDSGLGLTFNSMIEHMLHGRFDVDPQSVGEEGFLRDGRVYAYWGIFPALLRLPLLVLPHGVNLDVTRLSCIIATLLMFFINYKSWLYLCRRSLERCSWLKKYLFFCLALSGAQVCFLRSSLFQEVCLWSLVFGLLFVHWALRACLDPAETPRALIWMATAALLALLTRVSMGIGLYAATSTFGLLTLWRHYRQGAGDKTPRSFSYLLPCVGAIAILVAGIGLTALVNDQRWGNPLTFANYDFYILNAKYPDRLLRTVQYGLFNIQRIPLGIIYFFFPVWIFHWGNGALILQESFSRLVDASELPPSSFFLTDGFLLLLGGFCLFALCRRSPTGTMDKAGTWAIILGLLSAPFLMLMAISMNFRYRAEFYPLIVFMAFMGADFVAKTFTHNKNLKKFSLLLVILSIIASHIVLILYLVSNFGPPTTLLTKGVVQYYVSRFGGSW